MKVKVGNRKSWDGLAESGSMEGDIFSDENNQTNRLFLNTCPSAPSLLALDPQKQQQEPPIDSNHQNVNVEPQPDENDYDDTDADDDCDDAHDENVERPKLDEGFYEIESIRRRRVRKGQLQYLIKWRGWPETANTWEPVENLQACSDFIEAFEESLLSGKRKRKRKSGILHTHVKKRHQQRTPIPIHNSTVSESVNTGKTLPCTDTINDLSGFPPSISYDVPVCGGENVNNGREITRKPNAENGVATVLRRSSGGRCGKDYDPTLRELKIIPAAGAEKVAIPFQEVKDLEGNDVTEQSPRVQNTEPARSITRNTGAKRRKSGSVKRFKQEPQLLEAADTQNLTRLAEFTSGRRMGLHGEGCPVVAGGNPNRIGGSENALHITKIIKATGYTASVISDVQDVEVSFLAVRSDGVEVTVNNKFLKANDPHLLINFYEQNLRYSSTP